MSTPASPLPPPMRILFFANTDWYLFNFRLPLANALRTAGHEVLLVAPPGEYASRLHESGFRFIPFRFDRLSLNPAQQMSAVWRLAALYRRERPHLAHHFTIKCAVYGSIAARVSETAVVNAVTGLGTVFSVDRGRFRYTRLLVEQVLRTSLAHTNVIVQNPEDRDSLLRAGLAHADFITLIRGSGVDLERFRPRSAGAQAQRPRVLFAARLIRSKGVLEFEEVARRLRSMSPGIEFIVAGSPDPGNPDTLTAAQVRALTARGNVTVMGHVHDMPALLATVDLVVLPTTYGEGVPRILVEAAACGLPLVATNIPGCREVVRSGINGVLVPPGNLDALTAAVGQFVENDNMRATSGAASRLVASEFCSSRVIADTLRVYANALRDRGAFSVIPVAHQ